MREILFRGKRFDNGAWVEGAFCQKDCDDPFGYMVDRPSIIKYDPPFDGFWFPVDPETLGQYTGLTDKNGKKIFEGDICTYPDGYTDYAGDGVETFSIGVVTWYNEHPCFYLTNSIGMEWDEIWDSVSEITVIGNIHDNPELLEKGGT